MSNAPVTNPHGDHLPESPVDWQDIPLGPGQEPSPRGNLQFTHEGDRTQGTDTKRKPGYETQIVESRWPERPA